MSQSIAFIGVGNMGCPMAENLMKAGKSVKVFDVYEGDNIPENQKSIAISVTIQSSERTLNEKDLEKINNLIIKTVENKTGAKIRS